MLAGYDNVVLIGEGGLGRVYRARRQSTGGEVAIKELRDIAEGSPSWHRARREVDALLRLKGHPYVVSVEELLQGEHGPCLVMELAPNGSLLDRLRQQPFTPGELLLIGQQASDALAAAHEVGIVHRDVKPQNMLIGPFGQVKVCDFGIASLVRDTGSRTMTSAFTLAYASPEEVDGEAEVGPPTDVYSFGATMLHLITGRRPTFKDRVDGATANFGEVDAQLQPVIAVLRYCLAHDPSERPTMRQVQAAFDDALAGLGAARPRLIAGVVAGAVLPSAAAAAAFDLIPSGSSVLPPPPPPATALEAATSQAETVVRATTTPEAPVFAPPTVPPTPTIQPVGSLGERPRRRQRRLMAAAAVVLLAGGSVAAAAVIGSDDDSSAGRVVVAGADDSTPGSAESVRPSSTNDEASKGTEVASSDVETTVLPATTLSSPTTVMTPASTSTPPITAAPPTTSRPASTTPPATSPPTSPPATSPPATTPPTTAAPATTVVITSPPPPPTSITISLVPAAIAQCQSMGYSGCAWVTGTFSGFSGATVTCFANSGPFATFGVSGFSFGVGKCWVSMGIGAVWVTANGIQSNVVYR